MTVQNLSIKYIKIHRNSKGFLIFLQILALLMFSAVLYPVFRNRRVLGNTMNSLASIFPFSCSLLIISEMTTGVMTRRNSHRNMVIANGISLIFLLVTLGVVFGIYKSIGESSQESFQKEFLKVLENPTPKGLKTLHKFQQFTQCCGVPLPLDVPWNQSSIRLTNPWSSWFYYTILDEEYIPEARRLFTLPWSCCSDQEASCEHLAFERFSIRPSAKEEIIDELVEVEHRLRNSRGSDDPKHSVYSRHCEQPAKILLANVPFRLLICSFFLGFVTVFEIGLDALLIWKIQNSEKVEGTPVISSISSVSSSSGGTELAEITAIDLKSSVFEKK